MLTPDEALRDQAYQLFKQEAMDMLQLLEEELLSLQIDASEAKLHRLMRLAHSIKGGAATVNLPDIAKIAHQLEDSFRALHHWHEPIDIELEGLLLKAYDGLRAPLELQVRTGHYDPESAWQAVEPVFAALENRLGEAMKIMAVAVPGAAELGFDIVQEVFSSDVVQGITHLEAILSDPNTPQVAGEVRAQAEVFVGIGQLLGLDGFTSLAQTILQALNSQPLQALAIGWAALEDLKAAQALVLAGDRTQGGQPGKPLLSFTETLVNDIADDIDFADALAESTLSEGILNGSMLGESSLHEDILSESTLNEGIPGEGILSEGIPGEGISAEDFEPEVMGLGTAVEDFAIAPPPPSTPTESEADLNNVFGDLIEQGFDTTETDDFAQALMANFTDEPVSNWPVSDWVDNDAPSTPPVPLADALVEAIATPPATISSPPPEATSSLAHLGDSVRVALPRLERLGNLIGELVTQENGAQLKQQQMQERLLGLEKKFNHFERLTKVLKTWMDQSQQVEIINPLPVTYGTSAYDLDAPQSATTSTEFDPLQLDAYNRLYLVMQEAVEEIAQMGESMRDMTLLSQQTAQLQRKKQQTLKQVRNDLLWARMLPIREVLQRFPRMLRDLSAQYQKQVIFRHSGADTLVDKAMLEKLFDPLLHLVRNAFDHGCESPQERLAAGKPAEATIEIRAYHRGNQTFLEIQDDGQGIDLQKVRKTALSKQLLSEEEAQAATEQRLYQCLLEPGFSTRTEVTELSGRGVGLSTVNEQVQALKGQLTITSEPGQGTTFILSLPLTLTIAKLLVFSVDNRLMAISVDALQSIVMAGDEEIQTVQGELFYRYEEELIPLFPSSSFSFHYPMPQSFHQKPTAMALPKNQKTPLLIIADRFGTLALEVDHIILEQELVIKPFAKVMTAPNYLYGCTVLSDGSLVLVVDGTALVNRWRFGSTHQSSALTTTVVGANFSDTEAVLSEAAYDTQQPDGTADSPTPSSVRPAILVVDDSLNARQTLVLTLSKAGYLTIQASDGRDALVQLEKNPGIQAIFCDVEMPNMNGFEFLKAYRKQDQEKSIPVIMLTSRSGDKHRGIAKLLGATEYLTKPYLERELLQTLSRCLNPTLAMV
jgi:two-component system, chemotaxis family, sensor histidine kinase and response regulator PixL